MTTSSRLAALESTIRAVRCPACGRGCDDGTITELSWATDRELEGIVAIYRFLTERQRCGKCRPEHPCPAHLADAVEVTPCKA